MSDNKLGSPKARINGTGVVKRPDGSVRQDQIIEELQQPESKEYDDGTQSRIDHPNRPLQHRS